jgi:hypothetical protein
VPGGLPEGIRKILVDFRTAVREGNGKANGLRTDLRNAVEKLPAAPPKARGLGPLFQTVRHASGEEPTAAVGVRVRNNPGAAVVAVLAWLWLRLKGLLGLLRRAIRWVLRTGKYCIVWFTVIPLPWLVAGAVTLALVVAALAQYFSNATFGSSPVDYLVLSATALAATGATVALDKIWPQP